MDINARTRDGLNAKSIMCDVCKKSFKYKSQFVIHKRLHTSLMFVTYVLLGKVN